MSNPIVQIKRGRHEYTFHDAPFSLDLLEGEFCNVRSTVESGYKLFIGTNQTIPYLVNPEYRFSAGQVSDAKSGLYIDFEFYKENLKSDGYIREDTLVADSIEIPIAGENIAAGLINNTTQTIAGNKLFTGSVTSDAFLPETANGAIGAANKKWSNIFADNFLGNASTASKFASAVKINDTDFDGSAAITTSTWGAERNISISGTANADAANGTNINGSNVNGYVLQIPDTMTGFASITTTTLLPTNSTGSALGSSTQIWTDLHTKNPRIYNSNGNRYIQLQTDLTSTDANYVLILPAAAGELVYHSNGKTTGSAAAPVYIAASGAATECTTINVAHGGTGLATIASNGIMIGKGTDAVATIAPVAKGSILVSNGTNAAPKFAAPSLSWSAGNATTAPTVSFNLNSQSTSVTIPFASSSATGLVNTTEQTFAGAKTFSGAVIASNTLTVSEKLTANKDAEIKNNLIATSIISSTNTTKSSITLSDNMISMLSTQIKLDGKIILTNDSYGTKAQMDAISAPVEGQIFFLIS